MKKSLAIIPARMGSSRFPGKPMAKILGIPMIGHVYLRTKMCKELDEVYVATCDQEIFDYITSIGGKAVMTKDTHERCTDRVSEALLKVEQSQGQKYDTVVLVQGDEPLVTPNMLSTALKEFAKTGADVLNLMNGSVIGCPFFLRVLVGRLRLFLMANSLIFCKSKSKTGSAVSFFVCKSKP